MKTGAFSQLFTPSLIKNVIRTVKCLHDKYSRSYRHLICSIQLFSVTFTSYLNDDFSF